MMTLAMVQRGTARADASGIQSTDMLLNLTFVLLFLVGGHSLLAPVGTAARQEDSVPGQAIEIFIEDDGNLHFGSLTSPHVQVAEVETKTRAALAAAASPSALPVVVHHTAATLAGQVHAVLRAIQSIAGVRPSLALSRYTALPCRRGEGQ
jgi:hypothetical protein